MATISVELDAFYGYSCGFQSHGSNETVEIEVSDNELEALKKFGKKEITAEDIVAAIEAGDTTLESLHEQLSDKFYYMVEEYWLYEAYNECSDSKVVSPASMAATISSAVISFLPNFLSASNSLSETSNSTVSLLL